MNSSSIVVQTGYPGVSHAQAQATVAAARAKLAEMEVIAAEARYVEAQAATQSRLAEANAVAAKAALAEAAEPEVAALVAALADADEPEVDALGEAGVAVLPEEETGEETEEEAEEDRLLKNLVSTTQDLCDTFSAYDMNEFHDEVQACINYLLFHSGLDKEELNALSLNLTCLKNHVVKLNDAFDELERDRRY
jgi:hypothetical protein